MEWGFYVLCHIHELIASKLLLQSQFEYPMRVLSVPSEPLFMQVTRDKEVWKADRGSDRLSSLQLPDGGPPVTSVGG
jgi:hypothetical protein